MTSSTFMYIHNWNRCKAEFRKSVEKVIKIFKYVDYDLTVGNWLEGESFEGFMQRQVLSSMDNYPDESAFVYCNLDGETDEEIYRLFVLFAKIMTRLEHGVLIEITSDIKDKKPVFVNQDHGLMNTQSAKDDTELELILAKANLKEAEEKLDLAKKEVVQKEKRLTELSEVKNDGH